MIDWLVVDVTDESGVGEARRACAKLAERYEFDENMAGRIAIVTTEIASNLAKHGVTARRLFARVVDRRGRRTIEIVGVDGGAGIADLARAMRDGFSTAGTAGTGLGAVRRLSDEFDFHSLPGGGTVVVSRIASTVPGATTAASLDTGVFATPYPGETVCGDAWIVLHGTDRTTIVVSDGLGHGIDAAKASAEAVRTARDLGAGAGPAEQIQAMHEALRGTRGAAVGVASIRPAEHEIIFAGVGNISAVLIGEGSRTLVTLDGIVGNGSPRVREYGYPFPTDSVLVMHSDGITNRWDLAAYPGLMLRDPAIIAAVLHRDASRGRDDAAIVVARGPGNHG